MSFRAKNTLLNPDFEWLKAKYPPPAFVNFCNSLKEKVTSAVDGEEGKEPEEEEIMEDEDKAEVQIVCSMNGSQLSEEVLGYVRDCKAIQNLVKKIEKKVYLIAKQYEQ